MKLPQNTLELFGEDHISTSLQPQYEQVLLQ